jgi:predicted MFS family arabinose efflux permease
VRAPLFALFTAKLVSTFGSWLTVLALPWFVLVTTGSPTRMSAVLTAEFLGVVLVGFPSGRLVHRLGARRTMLLGDAVRAPLMALVPLLHAADALTFPALLTISFGLGLFTAPYIASQRLILPDLIASTPARTSATGVASERRLARANTLIDAATRIGALAGPALGGVLIALLGAAEVLWIDAASYAVSFLIVLIFVRVPGRAPQPAGDRPGSLAGLRYAARHRSLRLFLTALVLVSLAVPAIAACLPVLVLHDLGGDPRVLGLLTATNGAGLAAGSILALAVITRMRDTALTLAVAVLALPLWLMLTGRIPLLAVALFLSGLATPVCGVTVTTRFTLRTPEQIRPQVMTALTTLENFAAFLAFAVAGPVLQAAGLKPVFAAIALLATLGALAYHGALHTDRALSKAVATRPQAQPALTVVSPPP